jgi:hypothetical protein
VYGGHSSGFKSELPVTSVWVAAEVDFSDSADVDSRASLIAMALSVIRFMDVSAMNRAFFTVVVTKLKAILRWPAWSFVFGNLVPCTYHSESITFSTGRLTA